MLNPTLMVKNTLTSPPGLISQPNHAEDYDQLKGSQPSNEQPDNI